MQRCSCGCEDFVPNTFKEKVCANCLHDHTKKVEPAVTSDSKEEERLSREQQDAEIERQKVEAEKTESYEEFHPGVLCTKWISVEVSDIEKEHQMSDEVTWSCCLKAEHSQGCISDLISTVHKKCRFCGKYMLPYQAEHQDLFIKSCFYHDKAIMGTPDDDEWRWKCCGKLILFAGKEGHDLKEIYESGCKRGRHVLLDDNPAAARAKHQDAHNEIIDLLIEEATLDPEEEPGLSIDGEIDLILENIKEDENQIEQAKRAKRKVALLKEQEKRDRLRSKEDDRKRLRLEKEERRKKKELEQFVIDMNVEEDQTHSKQITDQHDHLVNGKKSNDLEEVDEEEPKTDQNEHKKSHKDKREHKKKALDKHSEQKEHPKEERREHHSKPHQDKNEHKEVKHNVTTPEQPKVTNDEHRKKERVEQKKARRDRKEEQILEIQSAEHEDREEREELELTTTKNNDTKDENLEGNKKN